MLISVVSVQDKLSLTFSEVLANILFREPLNRLQEHIDLPPLLEKKKEYFPKVGRQGVMSWALIVHAILMVNEL